MDQQTEALLAEIEAREQKATPGPMEVEKHESIGQGCWHYAIKTTYNHPQHLWSPRTLPSQR